MGRTFLKGTTTTSLPAIKAKNLLVSNIQFLLFPDYYVLMLFFFFKYCVPIKIRIRLNRPEISDLVSA